MNRVVRRRPGLLLLAGASVAIAGIAWGAAAGSRPASRSSVAADVSKTVPSVAAVPAPSPVKKTNLAAPSVSGVSASRRDAAAPASGIATKAPAAGAAGMRIFRDPETGEIGPPTAENIEMIARTEPDVDVTNLPVVALPGGGYELLIDGKIEDAMVMTIDAEGHRTLSCGHDPKSVHDHAATKAPATKPAVAKASVAKAPLTPPPAQREDR
jgi:hypothetical protein